MIKVELLKYIESLPDDLGCHMIKEDENNCIDIKIFTEKKSKEFYDWYFGM